MMSATPPAAIRIVRNQSPARPPLPPLPKPPSPMKISEQMPGSSNATPISTRKATMQPPIPCGRGGGKGVAGGVGSRLLMTAHSTLSGIPAREPDQPDADAGHKEAEHPQSYQPLQDRIP